MSLLNRAKDVMDVDSRYDKVTDAVAPKFCGMKVIEEIPDFILLYYTLVADQAIPSGYLDHFLTLEPHVRAAADRRHEKITRRRAD